MKNKSITIVSDGPRLHFSLAPPPSYQQPSIGMHPIEKHIHLQLIKLIFIFKW